MDLTPMDDLDCGNLYDQIDDLIDYPLDNECSNGGLLDSGDCKTFPSICNGALPDITEPFLLGSNSNLASDLSAEISVPIEDILELEWLPAFMEDSFSGDGMTLTMDIFKKKEPSQNPFLSISSPVSVLESSRNSSSCSLGLKFSPITRARTKRPRPATFSPCTSFQLPYPNPPSHEKHLVVHSGISSESEGVGESENGKKYHKPQEKMKPKVPLGPMEIKQKNGTRSVIRCQHCRITKTPQWRTGPMGPKTLCNACGVRYKSGRLLPEYRPVASPTFVPYLHSNRHRKVIKMRKKLVQEKSVVVKQCARTKRPRSATFSLCPSPKPMSHENQVIVLSGSSSESESVGESENGKNYQKLQAIEEKMITPKIPLGPIDVNKNKNGTQAVRRCQQCMITKTLHWRNGPMGPKTLCNACGVRYNSKRLFPERCPAASPSFAPYLHSNSHRKVTETRNELVEEKSVDVTQRARTKRPRSATYCPCTSVQLTSPNPPSHESHLTVVSGISSETEGCGEPENGKKKKYHNPQAMEEKMITPKIPLGPMDVKQNKNGTHEVKRCQHCAITKTLQWRNGPMGPKTLCNACGVRYNSGRLLPEYRPAASPTFVPSLHSNSHRQVIEMRNNKLVEEKSVDVAARDTLH